MTSGIELFAVNFPTFERIRLVSLQYTRSPTITAEPAPVTEVAETGCLIDLVASTCPCTAESGVLPSVGATFQNIPRQNTPLALYRPLVESRLHAPLSAQWVHGERVVEKLPGNISVVIPSLCPKMPIAVGLFGSKRKARPLL